MATRCLILLCCGTLVAGLLRASDSAPPEIIGVAVTNAQKRIQWAPYPAAQQYQLLSAGSISNLFTNDISGMISGYTWTGTNTNPFWFYRLQVTPLNSNALLTANLLNRLAYGPTPDELERVTQMGPQAYIDEQLDFGNVPEPMDDFTVESTNGVPPELAVKTNWIKVTVAGVRSTNVLYMYLTAPGDVYVDDIALYAGTGTNLNTLTNYVRNGDFESVFPGPWTVSANHANSAISTNVKCSGNASLRVVATSAGSTQNSSIWQTIAPGLTTTQSCTLSFWYLPRTNSSILTIRLSGSGVVGSPTNEPSGTPLWVYATTTGTASSSNLYIYLDGPGNAYIDDIKLVAGSVPEAGANVLQNGDFESAFPAPYWRVPANAPNSQVSSSSSHSGNGSLYLVFNSAGSNDNSAVIQTNIPLTLNAPYTLSYWYIPSANPSRRLTVRLSGSGIRSEPDAGMTALYRRLRTTTETVSLSDLRAWFCTHAVVANRQLLEVLTQFWENHFVTQHSKSADYLDRYYDDGTLIDRLAANMEFREINKWRNAMMNPNCTFYDLLEISAKSPAMIIYLDTVDSRADGSQIANENYARELLELFCNGVDNGYDQNDIVRMSRAWTGWTVRLVDAANEGNPFALESTALRVPSNNSISNKVGVWSYAFRADRHGTNRGAIFAGKTVPARFGSPWAGTAYQLVIPPRPTNNTNGIQDGYQVIAHLADLPFTMEYISVKLCRLFIHDDFVHGVYDYTDPNRSPEAELIRQCMLAWWNSPPVGGHRGNIRNVLNVILNSDLFRSHGGSLQKVKTPLEFVASSVRALRSANSNGTFTASTDGYAFSSPLSRMGSMSLFNRSDPDGYPEGGPAWISAGTLAERLRFIQSFLLAGTGGDSGNNDCDPVTLLKKLPAASWNNAGDVADYFLSILFPGEGKANLDLYRSSAINFLNTGDDGLSSSPFSSQPNTGATYDTRVRGMVSLLMTTQRFQEQ